MSLKKQAISGVIWTFAQQFSVQIINLAVQIILARLLAPSDFGLIAMIMVFIGIGQTLMDGGMTTSLIRTKRPGQRDYSTVFVTNMLMSVFIYILVFICAPYVARFYNQETLSNILRVFALTFVVRALVAVHVAKLTKEMNFKTQMKLQLPSTIIGAVVGVSMACSGHGVWSLVWLNLVQTIAFTVQNWIFIPWKPSLIFNKRRFKYHFGFGYKIALSGLLHTIYLNIYPLVIGKFYSPTTVGFFSQAETMSKFPIQQISVVLGKVTYPMFSNIVGDVNLKRVYKKVMKLVFAIVIPMMMTLVLVAEELFILLLGEKWLPAIPFFKILAFAAIVIPFATYNLNILKVKGRGDLFLKLEVYKKIIGIAAIVIALPFGVEVLVVSSAFVFHLMCFLDMIVGGKLINYRFIEQIKDISRLYLIGLVSLILALILKEFLYALIESQVVVGAFLIVSYSAVFLILLSAFEKKLVYDFVEIITSFKNKSKES